MEVRNKNGSRFCLILTGGRLEIKALPQYVGVDALDDPSYAGMKQKPCGFREAPALRARKKPPERSPEQAIYSPSHVTYTLPKKQYHCG